MTNVDKKKYNTIDNDQNTILFYIPINQSKNISRSK